MTSDSTESTSWLMRVTRAALRLGITLLMVAAATWAGWHLWNHYELSPWTRDGRVRANVVLLAPDVSGIVSQVLVRDNQLVKAGDVLFTVEKDRFELAVQQTQAAVDAQATVIANLKLRLAQAQRESRRNTELGDLLSEEAREQTRLQLDQTRGELRSAEAVLRQVQVSDRTARLNLKRTEVRAPVSGTVTNLDLRAGTHTSAGRPVMALVESASMYVEGYFEEDKLAHIHVGDRVKVHPMGAGMVEGTVESIAAGIAERDRSNSANLLPSVNPTFNWVRLAQRIPVRVRLDPVPDGKQLIAGQTVSVEVIQDPDKANRSVRGSRG